MPFKKGNTYGKGGRRPGAGRKSAKLEDNNYKVLLELFNGSINKAKIEKKIASNKFTAKDMFIYKLANGDRETLLKLFVKLFPDSVVADINTRHNFEGVVLDQ